MDCRKQKKIKINGNAISGLTNLCKNKVQVLQGNVETNFDWVECH